MNRPTLHEVLDDLASQEIPETMNLLPDIERRLKNAPCPTPQPMLRAARLVASLMMLFAFVTAAYAVYQAQIGSGGDAGIVTADTQQLLTPLGLSFAHPEADLNVTLDWAYADGNRISVGWVIDHAPRYAMPAVSLELLDRNGNPFPYAQFLRGGGGGGGGSVDRTMFGSTGSWDSTGIAGNPDSLDLTLVMRLEGDPNLGSMGGGGGSSSSDGGSGGGGGDSTMATPTATPLPYEGIPTHEFTFTFNVPFIPAIEVLTDRRMAVTVDNVSMALYDVRYAPSVLLGKLCYSESLMQSRYVPMLSREDFSRELTFGQESPDLPPNCLDITVLGVPADPDTETVTLEIDALLRSDMTVTFSDEQWFAFVTAIDALDLPVEVVRTAQGFDPIWDNEGGLTEEDITMLYRLAYEILSDKIDGPWVFVIPLAK